MMMTPGSAGRQAAALSRSALALFIVCSSAGLVSACGAKPAPTVKPPSSADVWAVVDGREIRKDDVEKAYQRLTQKQTGLSEEEVLNAKLGVLDELIMQDLLAARAPALKVAVTEAELDAAFAERKKNMPDDVFRKELAQRGLSEADMRDGLRREMIAQKVVAQEIGGKTAVSDQAITDFYNANRAQFNLQEPVYRIAQIMITPVKDASIKNRMNDDATTPETAKAKADMLMLRLKEGASFSELAMDYSEDPQTAPQGGDLGFVTDSALKQVPALLRDAVLKAKPGSVSQVSANGAHNLVFLAAREAAGQRDLTAPGVREGIADTLRGRKEQLFRTAYLTAVRNEATVVNYFAKRLIAADGRPPGLAPSAPGKQ
jgi:peptidyl-prolyl cis-trans isomerase SurA